MAAAAGAIALAVVVAPGARSGDLATDGVVRQPAPVSQEDPAQSAALELVDNTEVCMVNDRFFGREQIPVLVDGKTYFGCCEGCKKRLAEDESVRYALDPLTNEKVDKATAVVGARPDGSVLYFASRDTLERYGARAAS